MISINLLPQEYRKNQASRSSFLRNKRVLNGLAAGFMILTFFLYLQSQWSLRRLRELQTEWVGLEKDVQRVTKLKAEIEQGVKSEYTFLQSYVTPSVFSTELLSSVSLFVPASVWLLELKMTSRAEGSTLLLKGLSLPSREGSSIPEIEKYLSDLKEKFPSRCEMMLTTSRQVSEERELTLFTAVFKWV